MHPLFLSPSLLLSHCFLLFVCLPRSKDMAKGIPTVIRPGLLPDRIKKLPFSHCKNRVGAVYYARGPERKKQQRESDHENPTHRDCRRGGLRAFRRGLCGRLSRRRSSVLNRPSSQLSDLCLPRRLRPRRRQSLPRPPASSRLRAAVLRLPSRPAADPEHRPWRHKYINAISEVTGICRKNEI